MGRVLVKICGLTRREDLESAVRHGADAVGFVFAASPRQLTTEAARDLTEHAPRGIMRVGLFMDQSPAFVAAVLDRVRLDLLQFHGEEDNAYCKAFGLPFIKALSMQAGEIKAPDEQFPDAAGLLLDSHAPGGAGGTGEPFDWSAGQPGTGKPVWLAGGLNPDNVAEAIRLFQPYAVDVSSGVETAPGVKSEDRIRRFIEQARQE
jgi:phosphoribosylanthranilate isomerase